MSKQAARCFHRDVKALLMVSPMLMLIFATCHEQVACRTNLGSSTGFEFELEDTGLATAPNEETLDGILDAAEACMVDGNCEEANQLLLNTSSDGDLDGVKRLLVAGADVNTTQFSGSFDFRGYSPLHYASRYDHMEAVEVLIEAGAHVDAQDFEGRTPLYVASGDGNLEVVLRLISEGADVDLRKHNGVSPLMNAAGEHLDVVNALIAAGADVNAVSGIGAPVLFYAEFAEVTRALIDAGANVDARNHNEVNTLMAAAARGFTEVVKVVIDYVEDINAQAIEGSTALHIGAYRGEIDSVKILIGAGADVNIARDNGKTPLDLAIQRGHTDIEEILVSSGAKSG